jgi:hypothetical protein
MFTGLLVFIGIIAVVCIAAIGTMLLLVMGDSSGSDD